MFKWYSTLFKSQEIPTDFKYSFLCNVFLFKGREQILKQISEIGPNRIPLSLSNIYLSSNSTVKPIKTCDKCPT